LYGTLHSVKEI
jgi:hypothetical protein